MTHHYFKSALSLLAGTAIGLSALTAPAFAEWTGGDGQPTNPLPCTGEASAPAAIDYNGGSPKDSPDRAGQSLRVVDIPKLVGIGYFNATSAGVAEAAGELGTVEATTDGPAQANIDDQITLIDNDITLGRWHSVCRQRSCCDCPRAAQGAGCGDQRCRL